jgi:hypothetical protein
MTVGSASLSMVGKTGPPSSACRRFSISCFAVSVPRLPKLAPPRNAPEPVSSFGRALATEKGVDNSGCVIGFTPI